MVPLCLLTCDVLPVFGCEQLRKGGGRPFLGRLIREEALRRAVPLRNVVVLRRVLKPNYLPAVCFPQLPRLCPSSTRRLLIAAALRLSASALGRTALPLPLPRTPLPGFLRTPAGQLGASVPLPGRLSSVSLGSSRRWLPVLLAPRLRLHFQAESDGRSLRQPTMEVFNSVTGQQMPRETASLLSNSEKHFRDVTVANAP